MTSLAIFSTINFDVFENQFFLEYPKSLPTSFLNVWSQFVSGIMTSLRRVHISIMGNLNYDGSNDRSGNFFFFLILVLLRWFYREFGAMWKGTNGASARVFLQEKKQKTKIKMAARLLLPVALSIPLSFLSRTSFHQKQA